MKSLPTESDHAARDNYQRVLKLYPLKIFLILILTSACNILENENTSVNKVVISFETNYDPLPPASVKLDFWGGSSSINSKDMENEKGRYIFESSITKGVDYEFNIKINKMLICETDYPFEHVASQRGIRAKELKVNDKILDNSFLFINPDKDGANFIFKVNNKGEIVPGTGKSISVNDAIPSEIHFESETIRYPQRSAAYQYGNAWFSVVHDTKKTGSSQVEIDNLKFWARLTNGQDVLLASDDYNNVWGGKLYIRYPYFECSLDTSFMFTMPAQLINGKLVFNPSDITNRVWHGWCTGKWAQIPSNTSKLWVEAKVKIIGNALLQVGVDLKPNQNDFNGYWEYGLSDWCFQSSDFKTIYFNKPN